MKRFLRSLFSGFCFAVFGIGGLLAGVVFVPVVLIFCSKKEQKYILAMTIHRLWRLFVWFMCILKLIKIDIKDENAKKLKHLKGCIVVANHPSLIDVVILVSKIPRSICVVKGGLFKNFFIKALIRRVYLSNSMTPEDFMTYASHDLDAGYNIIIFPEGTRTQKDKPIHLHRGFAYLHLQSGHEIQPIYIQNEPHILGKNSPWYDVGDKTSVYTIKVLPKIVLNQKSKMANRKTAMTITQATKKSLFSAQNA